MTRLSLPWLVALALTPTLAADDASTAESERARHRGTWVATSMIRDGESAPAAVVGSIRREVEGDHVAWTRDGKRFAGTRFEVDPSPSPRALDLLPDGGPSRGERLLAIYKFEEETLTICVADVGRPRPVRFEAGPGSRQTLQAFRRVEPAGPK